MGRIVRPTLALVLALFARPGPALGPAATSPPVEIVAITVALSTDYEVILISRIAEHYRRTGDNRGAVVDGIEHTGSVITSAAAIMVAVFCGFALADLPPLKQLGVGLAVAVVLDATVVRGVLVPAAMAVMGRGNWWWPVHRGLRSSRRSARTTRQLATSTAEGRTAASHAAATRRPAPAAAGSGHARRRSRRRRCSRPGRGCRRWAGRSRGGWSRCRSRRGRRCSRRCPACRRPARRRRGGPSGRGARWRRRSRRGRS